MLFVVSCSDKKAPVSKDEEFFTLSFPKSSLQKGERIAGVEITVFDGSVRAINYIPEDWSISENIVYGGKVIVAGNAGHGVGWIDSVTNFDSFLLIKPWHDPKYNYQFDIETKLFIAKEGQEDLQIKILKKKDLILEKL